MTSEALRARVMHAGSRVALPLPDALMAAVFAFAALVEFLPPQHVPFWFLGPREDLQFGLLVEGGFLMMQGTLVDIATRLRKRPPLWLALLILAGVVLFSNEARAVVVMAWHRGSFVFIPLLLSLLERAAVLWRMPDQPRIRKIAERALIANRITTALGLFALLTAHMLVTVAWPNLWPAGNWQFFAAGAIYFAVAAYDDWRVRGKKFAERPTVLFRFDPLHISHLDPL